MKYIKLVIAIADEYQEPLIAELSEMEFDSFQQLDDELITFIAKERFHIGDRERIERLLAGLPGGGYVHSEEVVTDQNWNEAWEKTIEPQAIGPFLVKPTWSRTMPENDQVLLEVDPKMAFGTGYHETTRLMLRELPSVIDKGARVLDAGTGTGILAIAAVKLGAESVFAFDVDEWSITNARENVLLNEVSDQISIRKGSQEVIPPDSKYDIVLANIERNTILHMLKSLHSALADDGLMLLSGLLQKDEQGTVNKMEEAGLNILDTSRENEWIAIRLTKKSNR